MWLAQREDLPDTHKMWADPGSALEATLRAIGYVNVPAPGQSADVEDTDEAPDGQSGDPQEDETPVEPLVVSPGVAFLVEELGGSLPPGVSKPPRRARG